jgi:hypothetical protein
MTTPGLGVSGSRACPVSALWPVVEMLEDGESKVYAANFVTDTHAADRRRSCPGQAGRRPHRARTWCRSADEP